MVLLKTLQWTAQHNCLQLSLRVNTVNELARTQWKITKIPKVHHAVGGKAYLRRLCDKTKDANQVISRTLIYVYKAIADIKSILILLDSTCLKSTDAVGWHWNNTWMYRWMNRFGHNLTLLTRWLFFIVNAKCKTLFPELILLGWYKSQLCCSWCCSSVVFLSAHTGAL